MGSVEKQVAADAQSQAVTDGFHLVIDALKLNGIDTIFGLPGIPITDFTRKAQAEGMRVISFRHEQNAGNAAAIAGFMTQKPGICLTVSAPGFLNGLTALTNATTNCFPMILISGSSEREIVDLQQGDYEEMDQLAIAKLFQNDFPRFIQNAVARPVIAEVQTNRELVSFENRVSIYLNSASLFGSEQEFVEAQQESGFP